MLSPVSSSGLWGPMRPGMPVRGRGTGWPACCCPLSVHPASCPSLSHLLAEGPPCHLPLVLGYFNSGRRAVVAIFKWACSGEEHALARAPFPLLDAMQSCSGLESGRWDSMPPTLAQLPLCIWVLAAPRAGWDGCLGVGRRGRSQGSRDPGAVTAN